MSLLDWCSQCNAINLQRVTIYGYSAQVEVVEIRNGRCLMKCLKCGKRWRTKAAYAKALAKALAKAAGREAVR